jgi:hypothetical protein
MVSMFQKNIPAYPETSTWVILEGEEEGRALFVRRNESAKQLMGHKEYSYRVGFAIPLCDPNSEGLPSNEEMKILSSIEDALSKEVAKDKNSLLVLVITTDDMREFVYYTKRPDNIKRVVEEIRTKFISHEIQYYVKEDPDWEIYKEF